MLVKYLLVIQFLIININGYKLCDDKGKEFCTGGSLCSTNSILGNIKSCTIKCECEENSQSVKSCSIDYIYDRGTAEDVYNEICNFVDKRKCYYVCQSQIKTCYAKQHNNGAKEAIKCETKN